MERSPGFLARTIAGLAHLILGGTLLLLLAGLGGRWWVLELTTHFRAQYLIALAAATLLYVLVRRWRWVLAAALATIVVGATLTPFYWPHAEPAPASVSRNVRMISANILRFNADYQRTIDYVRETKPDLFFAMEITPDWAEELRELSRDFASAHFHEREDSLGSVFFSQLPVESVTTEESPSGVPVMIAHLNVDGRRFTVLGAHPPPPVDAEGASIRNESLGHLAEVARKQTGPVMIIGDYNCTSWSPYFKDLLRETKLTDSRLGRGLQPSWAPRDINLLPAPLRIPIDHCLVSKGIVLRDRRLGRDVGSDHLPIEVEFAIVGE